jgi:hypothetical protein
MTKQKNVRKQQTAGGECVALLSLASIISCTINIIHHHTRLTIIQDSPSAYRQLYLYRYWYNNALILIGEGGGGYKLQGPAWET